MEFGEFKEKVVEGLLEIYGDSADIETSMVIKNNGSKYNGLYIFLDDADHKSTPVVNLDNMYDAFESGRMDIGECVQQVCRQREALKSPRAMTELAEFAESAKDWAQVKDKVFPILLSTEENSELLEKLVSTQMLDLSVAYIIRSGTIDGCSASIKIAKKMMESYEISVEQLHQQAVQNMQKDGYEFQELWGVVMEMMDMEETEEEQDAHKPEMYVLTNRDKSYGAAGILNKKLLKEFAGDRDFIILPSSIHETLFVPVIDDTDRAFYDGLVLKVNGEYVSVEERLSDHSYYYDATNGEIRVCA